ncbi:hypothetical protein MSAN_00003500 [Mycena sanguinolenta]|uniref:Uncharacterized protein n=1 Tax=Mycena sanguinolenta TaxID=230812 RepID=A0A8H6ZGK7_9AGAR|nr:hypothetical protein MSAN_00003500 [Mycena sanguinolenta]
MPGDNVPLGSPPPLSSDASQASAIRIDYASSLGALTFLLWDILVTLDDEARVHVPRAFTLISFGMPRSNSYGREFDDSQIRTWINVLPPRKPWTRTKFIYFFIRYIPLCIEISTLLLGSPELTPQFHFTPHDCFIWEVYQGVGTVLVFGAVDYVLILRVYALYHNNPTILRVVFVAFALEVCGMCVGLGLSLGGIKFDDLCLTNAAPETLIIYGGSTLLFQTFMFILTIIKFITAVREGWGDTPLVGLVMRDGTWAFFLLFAVVAANSALFALKNHDLASILFEWILSVFSFSGYHIMLNLAYHLQDDGPRLPTSRSNTHDSPYQFTTRIVTDRDRVYELSTFRAEAGSFASSG